MKNNNSLLYEKPSFLRGIVRAFDLFGVTKNNYREIKEPILSDTSIKRDWETVGQDLSDAIIRYRQENKKG